MSRARGKKPQESRPLYDWVMQLPERRARGFFRLPACPHCGTQLPYRAVIARLPVFSTRCAHCGTPLCCRAGGRFAVLVLVLIALSALGAEFILNLAENTVPVFVFTLLLVICTYFLYPLTLYAQEKKKK